MSNGFPIASDTRNSWPLVFPSTRSGAATIGAEVSEPERLLIETTTKITMTAVTPPPINHHLPLFQTLAEV